MRKRMPASTAIRRIRMNGSTKIAVRLRASFLDGRDLFWGPLVGAIFSLKALKEGGSWPAYQVVALGAALGFLAGWAIYFVGSAVNAPTEAAHNRRDRVLSAKHGAGVHPIN